MITMDSITTDLYKKQLDQVNEALKSQTNNSDVKDLLQLRDDLTQLLSLCVDCSSENTTAIENAESLEYDIATDRQHVRSGTTSNIEDELSAFYNNESQAENDQDKTGQSNPDNVDADGHTMDNELANFYSEISNLDTECPSLHKTDESSLSIFSENISKCENNDSSDPKNEIFLDSIEYVDDISGVKCQAPFSTEWSGTQYHNAMIQVAVENDESICDKADNEMNVKVLFLNPIMKEMQPCPYYLEGNCKFDEAGCRYSHGYIVNIFELRPFVSPDYSNLTEGHKCLAKTQDGLWKPGIVVKIEDNLYSVSFLHKSPTLTLALHDLLPETNHIIIDENEVDSDEDILVEITPQNLYKEYGASSSKGMPPRLGLWEEHTNGIGSKLMQKMGYKLGEGLGKSSQGRLEPVPIVMLPVGKSLDHCMEVRLKKGVKHIGDTNQNTQGSEKVLRRKKRDRCVFSFLNKTLGVSEAKKDSKKQIEMPKDMFGIKAGTEQKNVKNFNKQMMKNEDDMKKIKAKVLKVKESLRRNQSNPSVVKSLTEKLDKLKEDLTNMKELESNIKIHKSRMETHRKMTSF
uniref:zinc finger CCCH-type with G patch domain-containing protein-like n=1 Tax=Styela clava TaxID=7725 RepID=UPI00193A3388|nr:zinc finger CCCH-type with G patch domain-containing protein-like [Styela clava]